MRIRDHTIGTDPLIIAEIGVNHDGDPGRAMMLTELAAGAGADAVKLQYFQTDRLMSRASKLAAYQRAAGETDPIAMLRRLELGLADMSRVVHRAHGLGIAALVSVFSTELVAQTESIPFDGYKSASPDIVHRPLLQAMAATGKPLIVSTGTAEIEEIRRARTWLGDHADQLAFLHCVSAYPTPPEAANVSACQSVAEASGCPVGYSDHTTREDTGLAAVRFGGAVILEKHFSDDASRPGPDHRASLEPASIARYVQIAKHGGTEPDERLRGDGTKTLTALERDVRQTSRQSVVSSRAIAAGAIISADDLTIKRPGTGLAPVEIEAIPGRIAAVAIDLDVPITPRLLR